MQAYKVAVVILLAAGACTTNDEQVYGTYDAQRTMVPASANPNVTMPTSLTIDVGQDGGSTSSAEVHCWAEANGHLTFDTFETWSSEQGEAPAHLFYTLTMPGDGTIAGRIAAYVSFDTEVEYALDVQGTLAD